MQLKRKFDFCLHKEKIHVTLTVVLVMERMPILLIAIMSFLDFLPIEIRVSKGH